MSLDQLKAACILVRSPASQGTAYLVSPTQLATCHHVVESAGEGGEVDLLLEDGPVVAKVTKLDKPTDCAILQITAPLAGRQPLPLAGRCAPKSQWDGYGFPKLVAGKGLAYFGMVLDPESQDDLERPTITLYSDMLAAGMAAPVNGLSGGPVLVGDAVVGHFSRVLGTPGAEGHPALGVIYAARAASVLALLGQVPAVPVVQSPQPERFAQLVPSIGPDEYHAFISYRSTDHPFAKRLYERLDAIGFRIFLDQREFVLGDPLAGRLHETLGRSRCGIVLVSRGWCDSAWCLEEGNALVTRSVNEQGRFRVIPLRLDDVTMPSMFASRVWIDFDGEASPSGRKLEQIVYAILDRPAPPAGSVDEKVQHTLTDATDEALRRIDEMLRDPRRFRRLVNFLQRAGLPEAAPRLRAAEALIGAGREAAALELLPPAEQSMRARQLRALALSKASRHDDALALLEPLFERGEIDDEAGGILGGIYKRIWQSSGGNRAFLIKAFETYRVTYARTGDSYSGINVAAMSLLLDKVEESRKVAQAILEDLGAKDFAALDHWQRTTVAEAFLIRGQFDSAAEWYERAVARGYTRPENIAAMRRQARLLLEKLGKDSKTLDLSMPVPPVVAFSGHLTDAPGRAIPRFPESKSIAVGRAIETWLKSHGGSVHAVCSVARGGDLLFLEQVLSRNGTATVFLPFPVSDFKRASVGQGWDQRFDEALANECVDVKPPALDRLPPEPERGLAFESCNDAIIKEAERLAQLFDDPEPTLLTVWNGSPGDGAGGTSHMVSAWSQRGYQHQNIDISKL